MNDLSSNLPPVKALTIFRLGLFNLGIGLMAVLTLAVLNRVMISELGIPGSVAAGTLAISQLVAPARLWFGQRSDGKPLFGLHRTGYVYLGVVTFGIAIFLTVQIVWQLGAVVDALGGWQWNLQTLSWMGLLALAFAVYGLGISASSTPFTALLVDISEEENRSKLVAVIWSMLMVGIVIGGISGSKLLPSDEDATQIPLEVVQNAVNYTFTIVPLIVLGLTVIATWGVEKKYSRYKFRSTIVEREDSITLGRAWKILTSSRQTGIFFGFLVMITLGLFMQEAVLEPYGGEVFNMAVGDTTLLNAYWGIGILVGYSLTGLLVVPRLGKIVTTKIGCIGVAVCFGLIILAGLTQEVPVLKSAMVLFGIAAGVTTVSSISLMLDLTLAETAGTFIGAWGLAQSMSRGLATWFGGIILDLGKAVFATPLLAYSLVFALESLIILGAIQVLRQVDVKEFKTTTRQALTSVMETDLD